MITLELHWPPSVNASYVPRKGGGGIAKNPKARAWRRDALLLLRHQVGPAFRPLEGPLRCVMELYPPTRAGDIDNRLKAIFDALEAARIVQNDSQVKRLEIDWCDPSPPGYVRFSLAPVDSPERLTTRIAEIENSS